MLQLVGLLLLLLFIAIIFRSIAKFIFEFLLGLAILGFAIWLLFEYPKIILMSLLGGFSALAILHSCLVALARANVLKEMKSGRLQEACDGLIGRNSGVKKGVFRWFVNRRDKYAWAEEFLDAFLKRDILEKLSELIEESKSGGQSIFSKDLIDEYVDSNWAKLCMESHLANVLTWAMDECELKQIEVGEKGAKEALLVKGISSNEISLD